MAVLGLELCSCIMDARLTGEDAFGSIQRFGRRIVTGHLLPLLDDGKELADVERFRFTALLALYERRS